MSDADLPGRYQKNLFNFQNFHVNCIELTRNGTPKFTEGYILNFANDQYIMAYSTLFQELECDIEDKSVSLTSLE